MNKPDRGLAQSVYANGPRRGRPTGTTRDLEVDDPGDGTLKAALKEVAAFLEEHGLNQEYQVDQLMCSFIRQELLDLEAWITEDTNRFHPCPECHQTTCPVTCRMAP